MRPEITDKIMSALATATCAGREGPYGLYSYGAYTAQNTDPTIHCVRDFRDPTLPGWGQIVSRHSDAEVAREAYERLTREHVAHAVLRAIRYAVTVEITSRVMMQSSIDQQTMGSKVATELFQRILDEMME